MKGKHNRYRWWWWTGLIIYLSLACFYFSFYPNWEFHQIPFLYMEILLGAGLLLVHLRLPEGRRKRWTRRASLGCGVLCASTLLIRSYQGNVPVFFYIGLLAFVAVLLLAKSGMGSWGPGQMAVNTVVLFCLALPVADFITRPNRRVQDHPLERKMYSFEATQKDPVSFEIWWRYFTEVFFQSRNMIQMPDPARRLPFKLKPNSETRLFDSVIHINSLGFRGQEFDRDKHGAYRIIAIGESTTMGCTLKPEDRPWPEVLEQLIRQLLHPDRPVQVINAGVPAYTLVENLYRLEEDILPLEPDMIISYHGFNGFSMIDSSVPAITGPRLPSYVDRPVYLLARCEYQLKLLWFLRQHPEFRKRPTTRRDIRASEMKTPLADYYRQWMAMAATNHLQLVLAKFNLAVNAASDPDVAAFYRSVFPVEELVACNEIHNDILDKLVIDHPDICLADTRPNLDGHFNKFIDLVHFTQEGRDQLAENLFTAIRPLLVKALGLSTPQATERPKPPRL